MRASWNQDFLAHVGTCSAAEWVQAMAMQDKGVSPEEAANEVITGRGMRKLR